MPIRVRETEAPAAQHALGVEDIERIVESLNKRSGAPPIVAPVALPVAVPLAAPSPFTGLEKIVGMAAPYIAFLVAMVLGYASMNTRVSTLEYQATISVADRSDLHRRIDKADDSMGNLHTDVGAIKVMLQDLSERLKSTKN